jgi:hypothetical protein
MTSRLIARAACLLSLAYAAPTLGEARARVVDCRIESAGKVEVSGKCRFNPDEGGSFTLENIDADKPLYGEILMVTVAIVSPGKAEVRGLTRRGVNSRWGAAVRSTRDRACWDGTDFRICAR